MRILNGMRFELLEPRYCPDLAGCFVSLVAPEDSTAVIAVREAAYAGNAQSLYRLHGPLPAPDSDAPLRPEVRLPCESSLDRAM